MNRAKVVLLASILTIPILLLAAGVADGGPAAQGHREGGAGVDFRGLLHLPLGDAILTLAGDTLEVSNIGSTGADGVMTELQLEPPMSWYVSMDPIVASPPGSFMSTNVVGALGGSVVPTGPETISTLQVTDAGDVLEIDVDFSPIGSPTYRLELYLDGVLVEELSGLSGTVAQVGTPGETLAAPWFGNAGFTCPIDDHDFFWLDWLNDHWYTAPGGGTTTFDEMVITAEDATTSILGVATIDLFVSGIPAVIITDAGAASPLFSDGFESGDTSAWSSSASE